MIKFLINVSIVVEIITIIVHVNFLQSKLLDMARDLLFNDNRAKLNNETLQKLAFLNGTAQQDHNAKLNGVPELNSTGELLSYAFTYNILKAYSLYQYFTLYYYQYNSSNAVQQLSFVIV